ncbi:MAG TPA: hypothetical protein VHY79_19590 [Rhizomicrobium sp.]|nr:hypothetical protein [Rhizomicrobium sp.]
MLFFAVFGNVVLAGFPRVMLCMRRMAVRRMGVVRSGFVASFLMMLRGFAVMPGRVLMVLGCAMVVFSGWMRVVHLVLFDGWATRCRHDNGAV